MQPRDHSEFCDDIPPLHFAIVSPVHARRPAKRFHASLCQHFSCFLLHGGHAERRAFVLRDDIGVTGSPGGCDRLLLLFTMNYAWPNAASPHHGL
jgi:hypothetical protein